jgi:NAD(P)-dependent dehydrogenase (short-subunit alcohol dehydrogenase family)
MTLVAARDLSPIGIRVMTIAPGAILTPAYGKAGDQLEAYWGPQVPGPGVRDFWNLAGGSYAAIWR